jgi:hypothetical protein
LYVPVALVYWFNWLFVSDLERTSIVVEFWEGICVLSKTVLVIVVYIDFEERFAVYRNWNSVLLLDAHELQSRVCLSTLLKTFCASFQDEEW